MPWISVTEARKRLDHAVSNQTLYRLVHQGKVKATRVLGKILLDLDSLNELVVKAGFQVITALPCPESKGGKKPKR